MSRAISQDNTPASSYHREIMAQRGPYETNPAAEHPRTLGERIKAVRMAWRWTQSELGAALNTDQTAVSSWERERVQPLGPTLAALAHLFGTTPQTLQSGEGFTIPSAPDTAAPLVPPHVVSLPIHPDAVTMLLDVNGSNPVTLSDTQEAILRLIQLTRDGKRVWIVTE